MRSLQGGHRRAGVSEVFVGFTVHMSAFFKLTVPPLSMSAVRMALCFSKVISASVPCFLTLWSLPQNWGQSFVT